MEDQASALADQVSALADQASALADQVSALAGRASAVNLQYYTKLQSRCMSGTIARCGRKRACPCSRQSNNPAILLAGDNACRKGYPSQGIRYTINGKKNTA